MCANGGALTSSDPRERGSNAGGPGVRCAFLLLEFPPRGGIHAHQGLRKAARACALVSQPPPIGHPGASPVAPCAKGVVSAAVSPPAPHDPRPIADIPFSLAIGVITDRFARVHGAGPVPTTKRACERMARAEEGGPCASPAGARARGMVSVLCG